MSYHPSTRGTVAARIQAFQQVETLEDLYPRFPKPPRALSRASEAGTITSRGHRKEGSFGTPACRTSRDGTDGIRGDGRPPVGIFNHKLHPSMEAKEEYRWPSALAVRPTTSLTARPATDDAVDNVLSDTLEKLKSPRKHRSMENVAEQLPGFTAARSRLKSTTEEKEPLGKHSPEPTLTMADLGDMVDYVKSSLEKPRNDDMTDYSSEQMSGLATPKTSMIRRWRSARAARNPFDTSTETQVHHPPLQHDGVANNRWHPGEHQDEPRTGGLAPAHLAAFRSISPVKQRAAMFEKMQQKGNASPAQEVAPDRHIHKKESWKAIPRHEPEPEIERQLHNLKFGTTIYDKSKSPIEPPIATAEAGHRQESKSSAGDTSSFSTAKQSLDKADAAKDTHAKPHVTIESPSRKASTSWMPKWGIFSKGASVTPQASEDNVSAVVEKDEHYPKSRPSVVQSRIQDLLSASQDRPDGRRNEQDIEHERLKRRPTPYPGRVTQNELKEKLPSPASMPASKLPPLQLPIQEEAEALQPVDNGQPETSTTHTSSHRSMQEKEVADSPQQWMAEAVSQPASVRSASPVKGSPSRTAPGTPRRGRILGTPTTPRGSGYAMEQSFVISPGRSRSRSRTSGSRMLVEVEVRDSPGHEAREMGQKIVFVRADVGDIDEEEEA